LRDHIDKGVLLVLHQVSINVLIVKQPKSIGNITTGAATQ